ncbi:addiction module antidote protein, HigA family, partial [Weissella cibaria]|nr:addiction module antidote protein, HigA family [Weissella cibaria]
TLIDLKSLKTNGFVENKRYSTQERISRLRILFNVSNLTRLSEFDTAVSYRIRTVDEKAIVNSNVMLELAMNQARNATTNKYSRNKLEDALPVIHQMITEDPS